MLLLALIFGIVALLMKVRLALRHSVGVNEVLQVIWSECMWMLIVTLRTLQL